MRALFAAIPMLLLAPVAATAAKPIVGHEFLLHAKVTLDQAREAALHVRPGEITDQELEKEKGGSGLRYSFDVKASGVVYEVGIDARTGRVLENAKEGRHPD